MLKGLSEQKLFAKGRGNPIEIGHIEEVSLRDKKIRTTNGIVPFKYVRSYFVEARKGNKIIKVDLTDYLSRLEEQSHSL